MGLEIPGQVQDRSAQNRFLAEQKCDQQAANPTVAVEERDGGWFSELSMCQSNRDQKGNRLIFMQKVLEVTKQPREFVRRGAARSSPLAACSPAGQSSSAMSSVRRG